MNVLKEIGYSYAKLENEELSYEEWEDSGGYETDYSYIVGEIIEGDWNASWRVKHYPKESSWAKDNNLQLLDGETGGEGSAEYCYAVFSWKDKIYKIEFSYYSHHGCDYDNVEDTIREVKPVEKVVIVYE